MKHFGECASSSPLNNCANPSFTLFVVSTQITFKTKRRQARRGQKTTQNFLLILPHTHTHSQKTWIVLCKPFIFWILCGSHLFLEWFNSNLSTGWKMKWYRFFCLLLRLFGQIERSEMISGGICDWYLEESVKEFCKWIAFPPFSSHSL